MANSPSNLIINYLPQTVTEKDLYALFGQVGHLESCRVMKDYKTGYSYGFGFVNYVNPQDAEKAIARFNGYEISNKHIKVSYARPSGENIKDTNLYITNLPRHYREDDLDALFGPYGTIVQKNLLVDKLSGMPRGVAFVRYDRREEAQNAISNLHDQVPEGGNEKLNVRLAEEHGKQKAAYYAGYHAGFQQNTRGRFNMASPLGRAQSSYSPLGHNSFPRGPRPFGRGSGMRGGRNVHDYSPKNMVSYPIRANSGFGPMRQDKINQRYNPIGFDSTNNL